MKQITVTQNNYHHPSRYLLDLYISFVKDEPGRGDAAYASSYRTKALLSASVTTEQNKKHLGSLYYPKNKKKIHEWTCLLVFVVLLFVDLSLHSHY